MPTFDEWSYAAYQQIFESSEFEKGKIYKYPSGDEAKNMNSQELLNYNKHIDVTKLPEGINGLVAMGGNVWEWIDDQKNDSSLTAGASWWYGGSKTSKDGVQFKPYGLNWTPSLDVLDPPYHHDAPAVKELSFF